jgi:hypothetical protein
MWFSYVLTYLPNISGCQPIKQQVMCRTMSEVNFQKGSHKKPAFAPRWPRALDDPTQQKSHTASQQCASLQFARRNRRGIHKIPQFSHRTHPKEHGTAQARDADKTHNEVRRRRVAATFRIYEMFPLPILRDDDFFQE